LKNKTPAAARLQAQKRQIDDSVVSLLRTRGDVNQKCSHASVITGPARSAD
jgi:hypothetical protein